MPFLLIITSAFEFEQKVSYFALLSLSTFLNTKTSVATNLNPLNSVNNFLAYF